MNEHNATDRQVPMPTDSMTTDPMTTPCDSLCLMSDHLALRAIGPWLADLAAHFDLSDTQIQLDAIELAVHEIAMNIVDHAYGHGNGTFTLTTRCNEDALVVRTVDHGTCFHPATYHAPDPDEPQVGGYGLYLVEQIADSVRYERCDDENRWELVFKRAVPRQ